MQFYIIYPKGNRTELSVHEISDLDLVDYDVASRQYFCNKEEAESHMIRLAEKHGKSYKIDGPAYLD
jgi:hypothetical protein